MDGYVSFSCPVEHMIHIHETEREIRGPMKLLPTNLPFFLQGCADYPHPRDCLCCPGFCLQWAYSTYLPEVRARVE